MDPVIKANPNGKRARTAADIAPLSENPSPVERTQFTATVALTMLPASIKSLALVHLEFLALQRDLTPVQNQGQFVASRLCFSLCLHQV
jgi:hypothetical protein